MDDDAKIDKGGLGPKEAYQTEKMLQDFSCRLERKTRRIEHLENRISRLEETVSRFQGIFQAIVQDEVLRNFRLNQHQTVDQANRTATQDRSW